MTFNIKSYKLPCYKMVAYSNGNLSIIGRGRYFKNACHQADSINEVRVVQVTK